MRKKTPEISNKHVYNDKSKKPSEVFTFEGFYGIIIYCAKECGKLINKLRLPQILHKRKVFEMKGKTGKIIALFLILLITGGLGYIAVCGVGEGKVGSYRNVSQGLDLAGGLSITYQVVGEDNPTAEDIVPIMDKIISFDKIISKLKTEEI